MIGWLEGKELGQIFLFKTVHSFAVGLINIFIPIYILQQGFPIADVFLFLLIDIATFTLAALPVGHLLSRIGDRKGLMASYGFYIPAFLLFQVFQLSLPLIAAVAVLLGIGKSLYWIPINSGFTEGSEENSRGSSYGKLMGFAALAGSSAPLVGAFILSSYGFKQLVSISVFLVVLSGIPLLSSRRRESEEFSMSQFSEVKNLELDVMFFFSGIAAFSIFSIFPVFVFYVVGGTINAGIVQTIAGASSAFFSIIVGEATDRCKTGHLIGVGTLGASLLMILAPEISLALIAFLFSLLMGLFYRTYHVPLFSIVANIGDGDNTIGFYSVREVFLGLGRLTVIATTVAVSYTVSPEAGFKTVFYLSAVALIATAYLSLRVEKN